MSANALRYQAYIEHRAAFFSLPLEARPDGGFEPIQFEADSEPIQFDEDGEPMLDSMGSALPRRRLSRRAPVLREKVLDFFRKIAMESHS